MPLALSALLLGTPLPGPAAGPPEEGQDVLVNDREDVGALPGCDTQNEVSLATFGDNVVAGWNDGKQCEGFLLRQVARNTEINLSGYGWSDDGGRTWHDGGTLPLPSGPPAAPGAPGRALFGDPVLAVGPDGSFYYATMATDPVNRSFIVVAKSTDGGRTFSPPVNASPGRNPDGCATTLPFPTCPSHDKPWIAVDTSPESPHRGTIYVGWTEIVPDDTDPTFRINRLMLSRSLDGGASFEAPLVLKSVLYVTGTQIAIGPYGEVYVAHLGSEVSMHVFRSFDGGLTFDQPVPILNLGNAVGYRSTACVGVDRQDNNPSVLNGDIRVWSWPSLAVDTSGSPDPEDPDFNPYHGRLYLAVAMDPTWDQEFHPILDTDADDADIVVIRSSDRGASWASVFPTGYEVDRTKRINDDQTTTDQFHPQVRVGTDGTVAVSWYDRRLSDIPNRPNWEIDLFAAISRDGGVTFEPNIRVSNVSFEPPTVNNPNTNFLSPCYMGEYNGMAVDDDGSFLVAWGDNRDLNAAGLPDPNVYFDRILAPSGSEDEGSKGHGKAPGNRGRGHHPHPGRPPKK